MPPPGSGAPRPRSRLTHTLGQGLVLPVGEDERLEGERGLLGARCPRPPRPHPALLWASVSPHELPGWKEGWGLHRPHPHPTATAGPKATRQLCRREPGGAASAR